MTEPFCERHTYYSRLIRQAEAEREVRLAEIAECREEAERLEAKALEAREHCAYLERRLEDDIRRILRPIVDWLASDPTVASLKRHNVEVGGIRFSWRVQGSRQSYDVTSEKEVLESAPWAGRITLDKAALRDRVVIADGQPVDRETGDVIAGLVVTITDESVTYTADIGGQKFNLGGLDNGREGACTSEY